jgi:hypothetical protein
MDIIARKPKNDMAEYIVVARHNGEYVSATADAISLKYGEWYWGHYFPTMGQAMAHFDSQKPFGVSGI